jgi:hypothetical protein
MNKRTKWPSKVVLWVLVAVVLSTVLTYIFNRVTERPEGFVVVEKIPRETPILIAERGEERLAFFAPAGSYNQIEVGDDLKTVYFGEWILWVVTGVFLGISSTILIYLGVESVREICSCS